MKNVRVIDKNYIYLDVVKLFSEMFKISKAETKRLIVQRGIGILKDETRMPITTRSFTFHQRDICYTGRKYLRLILSYSFTMYEEYT